MVSLLPQEEELVVGGGFSIFSHPCISVTSSIPAVTAVVLLEHGGQQRGQRLQKALVGLESASPPAVDCGGGISTCDWEFYASVECFLRKAQKLENHCCFCLDKTCRRDTNIPIYICVAGTDAISTCRLG